MKHLFLSSQCMSSLHQPDPRVSPLREEAHLTKGQQSFQSDSLHLMKRLWWALKTLPSQSGWAWCIMPRKVIVCLFDCWWAHMANKPCTVVATLTVITQMQSCIPAVRHAGYLKNIPAITDELSVYSVIYHSSISINAAQLTCSKHLLLWWPKLQVPLCIWHISSKH